MNDDSRSGYHSRTMLESAESLEIGQKLRGAAADHTAGEEIQHFENVAMLCVFVLAAWIVGKCVMRAKLPALFGEIIVGMIFGPHLLNLVPYPDALSLFGEIGLILLVVEAGVEVDIEMLKQIGMRGLLVAIVGSMLPLAVGTGISIGMGLEIMQALAVGASLAPTSMGIALNVLKGEKVLHTPCGQLIIAAAVIDDVIALILLSELKALQNGKAIGFIIPIVSSVSFLLVLGSFALLIMPRIMKLDFVKKASHDRFIWTCFSCMFFLALGLMAACFYGKSSYLLGAFLAGLCFCTVTDLKVVWRNQVKRVETWMLRIFFAATIAFQIPIQDLWKPDVLILSAALSTVLLCKVVTGVLAPPPLNVSKVFTVGFAMASWGEFAFIVASTSIGIITKDIYCAIVLALLVSTIFSPWALSITLMQTKKANPV